MYLVILRIFTRCCPAHEQACPFCPSCKATSLSIANCLIILIFSSSSPMKIPLAQKSLQAILFFECMMISSFFSVQFKSFRVSTIDFYRLELPRPFRSIEFIYWFLIVGPEFKIHQYLTSWLADVFLNQTFQSDHFLWLTIAPDVDTYLWLLFAQIIISLSIFCFSFSCLSYWIIYHAGWLSSLVPFSNELLKSAVVEPSHTLSCFRLFSQLSF